MDPVTGAVAIYLGKRSHDFLDRIAGPSADAVGAHLAGLVERRLARTDRLIERAAELCADPQPVPDRVFWPIVEHASLEDNEILLEMWAQLLATAASGSSLHPAITTVVSQLSPREAQFLEHLAGAEYMREAIDQVGAGEQPWHVPTIFVPFADEIQAIMPSKVERRVAFNNLTRLNLLERDEERLSASMDPYRGDITLSRRSSHALQSEGTYAVTMLGLSLLAALGNPTRE